MYDPEIYRHQIAEYYNPYVLDADIQAGEFYFNIILISYEKCLEFKLSLVLLNYSGWYLD